jgi:N-acetylgalactosamine kinase
MAWISQSECVSRRYKELVGEKPLRFAIAPGRVNLIGEHIDYSGFSVLPCAVARFTVVAVGMKQSVGTPDDFAISICCTRNTDPTAELVVQEVPSGVFRHHHWTNYVLAAYMGLRDRGIILPRNIHMVVGGDLPQACGLSSSSSLVVACALALSSLRLTRQAVSPEALADICIRCERYVGTIGGGMDQAAIMLSQPGFAMHIEFDPLRVHKVQLPPGLALIVANSMTPSAKAETAHTRYNKRAFECKLGVYLLRRALLPDSSVDVVEDTFFRVMSDLACIDYESMVQHCMAILPGPADISKTTIASLIPSDDLSQLIEWSGYVWEKNDLFSIQNRAVHVFSEAQRVKDFVSRSNDIPELARLMNESGESCDTLYDCSCPELRRLVSVMKDAGCLAARLTGAGWGGCVVGIVRVEDKDEVVERVRRAFYENLDEKHCFSFEPCGGAFIVENTN